MCVICAAAKKRHMKRAEVLEAIRHNNAGFFGFTVHDGARRTIRTLDEKQFMAFFDDVVEDDDMWVMHARIPSRGDKNIDNVHGWEEDGIIFCHNMTISSIDGMMKNVKWEGTDSEFFFRHIFMPFFRGCGPDAYKDGRFCQDLDNLVRYFVGYSNKFLFIMPDNTLVTYGDWVKEEGRQEDGKCAFYASNSSYKVYAPSWPASGRPVTGFSGGGRGYWQDLYGRDCLSDDDDFGDEDTALAADAKAGGPAPSKRAGTTDKELEKLVRTAMGDAQLCRIALCNIVGRGVMALRAVPGDWNGNDTVDDIDDLEQALYDLEPRAFDDNTYEAAVAALACLGDESEDVPLYTASDFAADYAHEFAPRLVKCWSQDDNRGVVPFFVTPEQVERALDTFAREWRVFARVMNIAVDFNAKTPQSFACAAEIAGKDGNRWKVGKAKAEDVLEDETLDADTCFKAVSKLLDFIKAEAAKDAERSCG